MADEMTREQALALATIIVPEVQKHAKALLNDLDDDDKKEMRPQSLAALESLSGITGKFCDIEPQIVRVIDDLGWIAKLVLGAAYAILMTFREILEKIAAVLCKAPKPATA